MKPYLAYKYSGVEWLGEVPGHWEVVRIKRVLARNDGGTWGEEGSNEDTPVLRSTEINLDGSWNLTEPARRKLAPKEFEATKLIAGDLLVTKSSGSSAHIGKTALVTDEVEAMEASFSNFMQRLRLDNPHHPKVYFHFFNNRIGREQLDYLSSTTTGLKNLNASILGDVIVPSAPFQEQTAIADYLDRKTAQIDNTIAKKQRLIAVLREERTAVISHAVTKGLNPDVAMKDSGVAWLGEIPGHWEVVRIKRVLARNDGGTWGEEGSNEDTPVLRSTEINLDGSWNLTEPARRKLAPKEFEATKLIAGDLLVTKSSGSSAHIGKTALVTDEVEAMEASFSNFMQRLRLDNPHHPKVYFHFFNNRIGREQLDYLSSTTTGLKNLNASILGDVIVPSAPFQEQTAIADYLDHKTAQIDKTIAKTERQIALLREYRTALISAVVTGKVDVRDEAIR